MKLNTHLGHISILVDLMSKSDCNGVQNFIELIKYIYFFNVDLKLYFILI